MSLLKNPFKAVVIGATGGIGREVVRQLAANNNAEKVYAVSRSGKDFDKDNITSLTGDVTDEQSLKKAAAQIKEDGKVQLVFVATGILHGENLQPEKALKDLEMAQMDQVFKVNTFGPALVAKHFTPLLDGDNQSVFAAISARVGSISDNCLGGWYAYRASKSALNMLLKGMSIELARTNKKAVVLGLHPGTVDTDLSEPFQKNVPEGKLFTPEYSAGKLLEVINKADKDSSGKVFDYAGEEVKP